MRSQQEQIRNFHRVFRHLWGWSMPLTLRRAQLTALTDEDYEELRDVHGASDAMLEQLRAMATEADARDAFLDFEHQTVSPVD